MNLLVAAMLVIHPVLDEAQDLRMVAVGTDGHDVRWSVDGREVARSGDREPVRVPVDAGRHEVAARTSHDGAWEILVRPDPRGQEGAAYVPAWTARHAPLPQAQAAVPQWMWALPILLVGAGVAALPRLRCLAKQP